jgi:hypothetical protein
MAGVSDPNTIDLVTSTADGESVLVMVEEREWDGADERIQELQAKIHNYVGFALDGQLARLYPETAGRSIAIQLDCSFEPDPSVQRFVEQITPRLAAYGIGFRVNVYQ